MGLSFRALPPDFPLAFIPGFTRVHSLFRGNGGVGFHVANSLAAVAVVHPTTPSPIKGLLRDTSFFERDLIKG